MPVAGTDDGNLASKGVVGTVTEWSSPIAGEANLARLKLNMGLESQVPSRYANRMGTNRLCPVVERTGS